MIGPTGPGNNAAMGEAPAMLSRPLTGSGARVDPTSSARMRELVDAHFDFVWRLLSRLGVPRPDLDDAAQQVFLTTSRKLADIPPENERTFVYGTALRVAATARRDHRRRLRFIEPAEDADAVSTGPAPDEELERRRALAFLDEVLHELADELREVFVLCEIEELSAPRVAAIIDIPVGTVASRLRRARHAFQQQVKRLQARKARQR